MTTAVQPRKVLKRFQLLHGAYQDNDPVDVARVEEVRRRLEENPDDDGAKREFNRYMTKGYAQKHYTAQFGPVDVESEEDLCDRFNAPGMPRQKFARLGDVVPPSPWQRRQDESAEEFVARVQKLAEAEKAQTDDQPKPPVNPPPAPQTQQQQNRPVSGAGKGR